MRRVGERRVRLSHVLEHGLRGGPQLRFRRLIRVHLQRELPVRLLNLAAARLVPDAQHGVVVARRALLHLTPRLRQLRRAFGAHVRGQSLQIVSRVGPIPHRQVRVSPSLQRSEVLGIQEVGGAAVHDSLAVLAHGLKRRGAVRVQNRAKRVVAKVQREARGVLSQRRFVTLGVKLVVALDLVVLGALPRRGVGARGFRSRR